MPGLLYLVATPIGNLEDITYRAVRVLGEADLIACEDTRQTRKLLDHYGIQKPTISYHDHNEAERTEELAARLRARRGHRAGLRRRHAAGLRSRLPAGARRRRERHRRDALARALGRAHRAGGLRSAHRRLPLRRLPAAQAGAARRRPSKRIAEEHATVIFYEAPHRILEALEAVEQVLGARPVVVARELTKIHEEFLRGTAAEIRARTGSSATPSRARSRC